MTLISSDLQTSPRRSRIAVAVWLTIALAYLAFFAIELRLDYNQLLLPCEGEGCAPGCRASSTAASTAKNTTPNCPSRASPPRRATKSI